MKLELSQDEINVLIECLESRIWFLQGDKDKFCVTQGDKIFDCESLILKLKKL